MPLPPPFTKLKRLPEMRAFVAKSDTEFTYFIREDSPLREGYHKYLHELVQLCVVLCGFRYYTWCRLTKREPSTASAISLQDTRCSC
jgi:hypothetical protein